MSDEFKIPEKFENSVGKLSEFLKPMCTEKRYEKFVNILEQRSKNILTVFESTHHMHNISAVIRNIDSFGFMNLMFIYTQETLKFRISDTVDRGSSQWLFLSYKNSIAEGIQSLKNSGYKIAAVTLPDFSRTFQNYQREICSYSTQDFQSLTFQEIIKNHKIALIFGSELAGISREWQDYIDFYVSVSMFGFCESLNVSVCAAVILNSLRTVMSENQLLCPYTEKEKKVILDFWLSRDYRHAETLIQNKNEELYEYYLFVKSKGFLVS